MKKCLNIGPKIMDNPQCPTHFLCLPLCTPTSRAKLQTLVETLRSDEASIGFPRAAFRLPNSFHLQLCNLRIETPHDLDAVSDLLRGLDMNELLGRKPSDLQAISSGQVKFNLTDARRQVKTPPVKVTLKGLIAFPHTDKARALYATFQGDSDRLDMLVRNVSHMFASRSVTGQPSQPDFTARRLLGPNLLDTRYAKKWDIVVDKDRGVRRIYRAALVDTRYLIEKYKDTVWVEDMRIEKVSLCKEGRLKIFGGPNKHDLVDEGFEEVASIPLPQ